MIDLSTLFLAAVAGVVGDAMNALAGGGTFETLPALIALGLPANFANATSNVALLPGTGTSAWARRHELGPLAGIPVRVARGTNLGLWLGRKPASCRHAGRDLAGKWPSR